MLRFLFGWIAVSFGLFALWVFLLTLVHWIHVRRLPPDPVPYPLPRVGNVIRSNHWQKASVRIDPHILVTREDGSIILDTTLLEWVGRAIVLHHLPQDLDEALVYLDGERVVAP